MQIETSSLHHDGEMRQAFEPEMVYIAAGLFVMGSDPETIPSFEDVDVHTAYVAGWTGPQHRLYLPAFYLAKTPVTNAEYAAFIQSTGHQRPKRWRSDKSPKGKEQFPVVYVSWHDAVAYCRWLSAATGRSYRLPSEAEWEKGASWAYRQRRYPWGDEWDAERCNTVESEPNSITPVDAHLHGASPYGLLDMAGNVWEWTLSLWGADWYTPDFGYPYDPTDGREDLKADDDVCRVLRGGSFAYSAEFARCAFRYKNHPKSASDGIGFRVALSASE